MEVRNVLVRCGGADGGHEPGRLLELNIDAPAGSASKVNLDIDHLTKAMVEPLPHRLEDLLRIACYVFCADQFVARDTPEMQRLGESWRRSFHFRIPVQDLEFWRRRPLIEQLVETLSFLSEDAYSFEFIAARERTGLQPYLRLQDGAPAGFLPDEILLFSGGLDSLAGAALALMERGHRVALVSHRSSGMIDARQRELRAALGKRVGLHRVFHVSVSVNKGGEPATEYTQRSRSFLFAALGFIVARLFQRTEISFAENGVVSLNLPIAPHVIGTRSTRTTHPKVLAEFDKLFSLIAETEFRVENPLFWLTKTDAVRRLSELGCADLIPMSFSCSRVGLRTRRKRHCGTCSQCIDRRFAVLAAGLSAHESTDQYMTELFEGELTQGADITLAVSYILAARTYANMSELAFTGRFGEVFRALPYIESPASEAIRRLHQLHDRHGKAVIAVVNQQLVSNASIDAILERRQTTLLTIIGSQLGYADAERDMIEREPPASEQIKSFNFDAMERPIIFAIDKENKRVLFQGGAELTGALFALFHALFVNFEKDQAAHRKADEYRITATGEVAELLGVAEPTVRKNVTLARQRLRKQFSERLNATLGDDDIIENVPPRGYRISPYLQLVPLWRVEAERV